MRLGAIFAGSLAAVLATVALFAACSGVTRDTPPGPPGASAASSPAASPAAPAPSMPPTDAGAPTDAGGPGASTITRSCQDPRAAILNHPDGGVVFNNAMTSVDAGFIDRGQAVLDALATQATAFRCCFDPWVRSHPEEVATMMLRVTLAGDGSVVTAEVAARAGDLDDEATRVCVATAARETSYPPSPTGKETTVEYPFRIGTVER